MRLIVHLQSLARAAVGVKFVAVMALCKFRIQAGVTGQGVTCSTLSYARKCSIAGADAHGWVSSWQATDAAQRRGEEKRATKVN
jgi:hypothetical protein